MSNGRAKFLIAALAALCGIAQCILANAAVIPIFGEIDHAKAESVAGQIVMADASKDAEPILLLIDSPGGDVSAGKIIASAIRLSKHTVNTLCIGDCESMAAMLFEMGKHRYLWPLATLMLHSPHLQLSGTPEQVANEYATIDSDVLYFETIVSQRAGLTLKNYRALIANELFLSAPDAVTRHFADVVVTGTALPLED